MHPAVVADAGGLLVLAGLLEGARHEVDEILALDATALLVAEYLALRHAGTPRRARVDYGLVMRVVREWYPVRPLAMDAALSTPHDGLVEGTAALALAETLTMPFVTKDPDVTSRTVTVLNC